MKRRSDPNDHIDTVDSKKPKRNIQFSNVTVYYFPRIQGFTCIPSQGGCTLGMGPRHYDQKSFTLSEHSAEQKRLNRLKLLEQKPRSLAALALLSPLPVSSITSLSTSASVPTQSSISTTHPNMTETNTAVTGTDERSRSSTEESDSEEDVLSDNSSSEYDTETSGFLQPVPQRQRRALLKAAGVREIASYEKNECRDIRLSREYCGCNCRDYCDPETCFCSQSGIKCQVDRASFPCGCSQDGCGNVIGRIEFNPKRVRTHFIHTIMRLEMEKKQKKSDKQNSLNTYDGRLRLRDSDDDCSSMPNTSGVTQHRQSLGHLVNYNSSDTIYSMSTVTTNGTENDPVDNNYGTNRSHSNQNDEQLTDNPLDLHYAFRNDYQIDITNAQDQSTSNYSIYGNSNYFTSTTSVPFDDFTGLAQSSQPPEITTPYTNYSNNIFNGILTSPTNDLIDNVAASCSYVNTYTNDSQEVGITNSLFENAHKEINVLPLAPTLQFDSCSPCRVVLNRMNHYDETKNLLESTTELNNLLETDSINEITINDTNIINIDKIDTEYSENDEKNKNLEKEQIMVSVDTAIDNNEIKKENICVLNDINNEEIFANNNEDETVKEGVCQNNVESATT